MVEIPEIRAHKRPVCFVRREQVHIASEVAERSRWSVGGILIRATVSVPAIHDLLTVNR